MPNIFKPLAFTCIIGWLLVSNGVYAQTDSTSRQNDSLNAAILRDYNKKIFEIDHQRIADSVKRTELQRQLNALKTTDNLKKAALQQQLQELQDKEVIRLAIKKTRIDSLRKIAVGYPVQGFFNDTLFLIYSKLGSFSASDRAEAIIRRLDKLAHKFNYKSDSLKVQPGETTVDIVYGETSIMSVSENDALWSNNDIDKLSQIYRDVFDKAIMRYKSETSLTELSKEIGLALLVILIIVLIIFYIGKLFKWTALKIHDQRGKAIKGIKLKTYVLFDAQQQVRVLLNLNTVVKWIMIILSIYLALPVLFGIFPWTQNFANKLFGYILKPVKKIAYALGDYLPNLITILVIITVFRYVIKFVHFLKVEIEHEKLKISGFYADWANPTYQIIRVLIFAFLIVVIFPYLPGSESPIFKGVSVFLGFLFTFGSAGSLSNIIAGLLLTYMRLFKIGDRVKVGDVIGDVIEKSLLVTRIRTIKNEIISIPNATIMSSHTVNYSSDACEKGLILHTIVTIGYDVPWRKVHDALIEAAGRTGLVLKAPEPFVLQTGLEDFYVSYQLNAFVSEANKQAIIYSQLHQNIQDVFNEKGIEILSPHYRAARDGNASTIPASYLPNDYKAPNFNINTNQPSAK